MAEDRRRAKGFLPGCAQPYPWQRGRSSMAAPVEGARETLTANVRGRGEVVNGQEGGVGDGVGDGVGGAGANAGEELLRAECCGALLKRGWLSSLERRRVLCVMAPLDVRSMRAAALAMHGTHDWSAFRSNKCEARSPVRTLEEVAVIEEASLTPPTFPTCHALGFFSPCLSPELSSQFPGP